MAKPHGAVVARVMVLNIYTMKIACLENPDTAIVGDWWTGVGGHHVLYC